MNYRVLFSIVMMVLLPSAAFAEPSSLWLEKLTSPEIKQAIGDGYTIALISTAGIEQNGPHMPLNKHHLVVSYTAEKIAIKLGNTLIAPVLDFVPEGDIATKTEHMAFAGTISIPPRVFAGILENTARSLLAHGFTQVFFMGDSFQNQEPQKLVASKLQNEGLPVFHVAEYYANRVQEEALYKHGFSKEVVGGHAGLRDTSELMAVAPDVIRRDKMAQFNESEITTNGAWGGADRANIELGQFLLDMKVAAALEAICKHTPEATGCKQAADQ